YHVIKQQEIARNYLVYETSLSTAPDSLSTPTSSDGERLRQPLLPENFITNPTSIEDESERSKYCKAVAVKRMERILDAIESSKDAKYVFSARDIQNFLNYY